MNLTSKAILLTSGILSSFMVLASSANISLTNDLVKGDVSLDAGASSLTGGDSQVSETQPHDDVGTFYFTAGGAHDASDHTSAGYIGLSVQDTNEISPLQIGLGIRLYALDNNRGDKNNVAVATALGGWYRYTLPTANRLSIFASGYDAPTVLSVSWLDHMYTYDVRGEYMTTRHIRIYIGYGRIVSHYENDDRVATSKGASIGASVDF